MNPPVKQPPEELPAVFGRYQLVKLLGKGGMGSVYLAHDSQLDRSVALKIPQLDAGDDSKILARFLTEGRAAAALTHPNICPIYDVGEMDGLPYLTMAYIDGKPLDEFVRHRSLQVRQSALLVRKLALALHEAHKRGVIHRDLKPANLMIDKRSEPIIMDFGLARRVRKGDARLTQDGMAMGTPSYMPPEQIHGDLDAMGPSCDIYSLGVILYELLAGRLPFTGEMMVVLAQVLTDEPPPPSEFRPHIERELEAICLKMLAKKPEDRQASMAELAAELAEFLRSKPPTAESPENLKEELAATLAPPPLREVAAKQTEGFHVSQMGGLRSVAQLQARVPTVKKPDGPRTLRRRKKRDTRLPVWLGLGGAALVVLLGWILFRATDYGTIRIDCGLAAGAVEMQVDGKPGQPVGAELRLAAGPHRLTVVGRDYETVQQDFTVFRGRNADLPVVLQPRKRVASVPPPVKSVSRSKPPVKADPVPPSVKPVSSPKPPVKADPVPPPVVVEQPKPVSPSGISPGIARVLDELMKNYRETIGCSAAVLAVDRNGAPYYSQGYGFRLPEGKRPVRPDTLFGISMLGQQPLLPASIRTLAKTKGIRLNDPILPLLNVVPRGRVVDPRIATITLNHILQNKTGWDQEMVQRARKAAQAKGIPNPVPADVILGYLVTGQLKEAPGTKELPFRFSPSLRAYLVTKISGQSYVDYVRYTLMGRELRGIAAPGSPEALAKGVWNANNGVICVSASALLEVMRSFSYDGREGKNPPGWSWSSDKYYTCHLNWRADGLHVVLLFNGRGKGMHEFPELHKVLDTLKQPAP